MQIVFLGLDPGPSPSIYEEILEVNRLDSPLQAVKEACKRGDKRYSLIRLNGIRVDKDVLYRNRRL